MTGIEAARQVLEEAEAEIKVSQRVSYLARKLELHPRTIRRWCKSGQIVASQFPSGRWRISLEEVYRLVGETK